MLTSNYKKLLNIIHTRHSDYWIKSGQRRALHLFQLAARRVPAYRDFLYKNNIQPDSIQEWSDYNKVPPVSKKNYLKIYPLEKLHWEGSIRKSMVWTSTSGSTGFPIFFSRDQALDTQYATILNDFLRNSSYGYKSSTLVIIGFGMGVWIGGLITYQAYQLIGKYTGIPISIITPGVNKEEILKILQKLGHHYNQIILVGYPPFLKDVIDEAIVEKIPLHRMHLRLHFAAEAITESFRNYLSEKIKINNIYRDIINIYGSADLGAMAYEGATSILAKRLALKKKELFTSIFSNISKTPTLAQFNSNYIFFEAEKGALLLTGNSTIPLIRYNIGDNGGTFSFKNLTVSMKENHIHFFQEAKKEKILSAINEMPFVYVYERSDFSTNLYGINIYPEVIREALLDKFLTHFLSGKFTMLTKLDSHQNQYLEINLELIKGQKRKKDFFLKVLSSIEQHLRERSSEYRELSTKLRKKNQLIKVLFWPFGYKPYFIQGIKQKWVMNNKS